MTVPLRSELPLSKDNAKRGPDFHDRSLSPSRRRRRRDTCAFGLAINGSGLFRRGFGFVGVDQAIAVAVDAVEVGLGAEELAARNVAVAVAVHLAEPQRTPRRDVRADGIEIVL